MSRFINRLPDTTGTTEYIHDSSVNFHVSGTALF